MNPRHSNMLKTFLLPLFWVHFCLVCDTLDLPLVAKQEMTVRILKHPELQLVQFTETDVTLWPF